LSMTPAEEKTRLIELVRERSFKMTDEPSFKLTSGAVSRFYFNMKPVTHTPEGMFLIGSLYLHMLENQGIKARAIGGLTMGADPISAAVALSSWHRKTPIEAFVIRKEPKKHGTRSQVEGYVREGDPVVIVDDVVTTGGSTIKAIEAAERAGLVIKAVVVLLDRCEQNGRENIAAKGYPVHSILDINDFL